MNTELQEGSSCTVIEGVGIEWFESDKKFIGEVAEVRVLFFNRSKTPMAVVEFENGDCLALLRSLLKVTPVSWTGEGLPPVGTVCEVLNIELANPEWEQATILYVGKHRIMYDSTSCNERVGFIGDLKFRPIRTPEQIAAEEREATIRQMLDTCGTTAVIVQLACEQLFDTGYRKFEIVEEEV